VRIRRITSHSLQAIAEAALIAMLVVGLMAGTAFAGKPAAGTGGHGKPGSGGTGTLAVVIASDSNGDGAANWGDSVTYTVSTTATLYPYVSTSCYQGTTQVLGGSAGFFASYPWPSAQVIPLTSMLWTSGAADCTATLYSNDGGNRTNLKTISFHVNP
jgi:hypothetical protein